MTEQDSLLVRRLRQFRDIMNPNFNSTTLYHGLDDILKGKKPSFYEDNGINFIDLEGKNFCIRCESQEVNGEEKICLDCKLKEEEI